MLKISIFVAKMRKPIVSKLVLFLKSQKLRRVKVKLLQNKQYHNYGFITEYEFSPSKSTRRPLIGYNRRKELFGNGISLQRVYSMLFLCQCLGRFRDERGDLHGDYSLQLDALPAVDEDVKVKDGVFPELLDWGGSIDLRAERFIERFYEEMRMQRQVSL
ncbi:cotton fiber protein [Parasponia andersonii]|uniref:Cotton fiber protein n=1 Tax=Parasponia andersonii TaxID=3476 RepID=A0A2P5DZD4_PARAD|nr:cotton fiber protein [Parasponia andersonii]